MTTISVTAIDVFATRLCSVELFDGLTSDEVLEFLSASDDLAFNAGEIVVQAGDVSRSLYLLLEGRVEIEVHVPKLGERVLAQLEAGSIFGELSFFHPAPHAATARCLTAARVACLSRSRFDALASENPHLALRITANAAEILAARLQHTDEWIVDSLTRQREHEIREKWRNLKHSLMSSFVQPKPFISVGANLQ